MQSGAVGEEFEAGLVLGGGFDDGCVGIILVFGNEIDDVHAEAGDAAVEPEAEDVVDCFSDLCSGGVKMLDCCVYTTPRNSDSQTYLRILPIKIRLLRRKQTQVVFTSCFVPGPGRMCFS